MLGTHRIIPRLHRRSPIVRLTHIPSLEEIQKITYLKLFVYPSFSSLLYVYCGHLIGDTTFYSKFTVITLIKLSHFAAELSHELAAWRS